MNEHQKEKTSKIDFRQVLKEVYVCSKLQINPDSYLVANYRSIQIVICLLIYILLTI